MRSFLLSLFLLCSGLTSAQVIVNGKDINKLPDVEYIELIEDQLHRPNQVPTLLFHRDWGTKQSLINSLLGWLNF